MIPLKEQIKNVPPLVKYLFYSGLVTIIDIAIVWVLYKPFHIHLVIANTIGVVCGFILHYILSSKSVFNSEYGIAGLTIYLATFLFGLVLANILIYVSEYYLFTLQQANTKFLLSKGVSIIIPFFALYYVRKFLFESIKKTDYEDSAYGEY